MMYEYAAPMRMHTARKGPHQFGSIKGFGAGARRGTLFSQKKLRGALEGARVLPLDTPSGARLGIARNSGGPRAHTSLDRARLPERGCRTIGAWQPLLGCAEAKRLPRAPLSGNQQPRWQPAASAWLPASRRVAASPGAAKPRLATACRRPTRPFCLQMGGRTVVVASSPALTVES